MFGGFDFSSIFGPVMGVLDPNLVHPQMQQRRPPQPDIPPPASVKAINSLHSVQVTAEDLLEETNKECLICLSEQEIGSFSVKLPCGHLYHRPCLVEWLEKHCTCPVCRYEIESADPEYESKRQQRMKERKLRYRRDELDSMSIHSLRELMRSLGVASTGCFDKRELVDRLILSDKITLVEGIPAMELTEQQFLKMGISELKKLLHSFGISSSGALEKADLRERLLRAGRVILVEKPGETQTEESESTQIPSDGSFDPSESDKIKNEESESANHNEAVDSQNIGDRFKIHEDVVQSMSIRELLELMRGFDIPTQGCVERAEMIRRIRESDAIEYMVG